MSFGKSIGRMLCNVALLPVDAVRDIASIGDETKNYSLLVERARRFANSATDLGNDVVDVTKISGKSIAEISKEVGSGFASIGKTIQNVADGKEKSKENVTVRVSEEAIKESKEN